MVLYIALNAMQMWRASSNTMHYGEMKANMNKIEKDKILRYYIYALFICRLHY